MQCLKGVIEGFKDLKRLLGAQSSRYGDGGTNQICEAENVTFVEDKIVFFGHVHAANDA